MNYLNVGNSLNNLLTTDVFHLFSTCNDVLTVFLISYALISVDEISMVHDKRLFYLVKK